MVKALRAEMDLSVPVAMIPQLHLPCRKTVFVNQLTIVERRSQMHPRDDELGSRKRP